MTLADSVQTHMALLHSTVLSILRYTKRAGVKTGMAADAFVPVHQNNPIFGTLKYCTLGTG